MFLIRTAFWLTLLILILPSNAEDQRRLLETAGAAVKDVYTFCDRNPTLCEKGQVAYSTLEQKAQFGAKMLMAFIEGNEDGAAQSRATSGDAVPSVYRRQSANTLTDKDLQAPWSAPERGTGI